MTSVATDLILNCRSRRVQLSSTKLIKASRNAAFKEIVEKAMQEREDGKPAELGVPEDDAGDWEACVAALSNPATPLLSWRNLLSVLRLADKYELRPVLEVCQDRIVCAVLEMYREGPFQEARLDAVWKPSLNSFIKELPNVEDYSDIAITLYTTKLMPAYRAFVSAWIASSMEQRKGLPSLRHEQQRKKEAREYNMRIQRTSKYLRNGPAARLQLLADILKMLAIIDEV